MLFHAKTTSVSPAEKSFPPDIAHPWTWVQTRTVILQYLPMKIISSKWTRDIHNNTYCKFLLLLITRFSKYIRNQVPVKVTVTFIYLDCNSENCIFCKISDDCVEIHLPFRHLLLTFLFTPPMKVDNHSLVGIHPFSIHNQSHYMQPWRNSLTLVHFQIHCHCQTDLSLLFSSQHSLFFLLLPHYLIQYFSSFCQISLKQHHYPILQHQKGFVLFLQLPTERSITTCPSNRGDNWYSQKTILSNSICTRGKLTRHPTQNHCHFLNTSIPKSVLLNE